MADDGWRERLIKLESRVDSIERYLNRMDTDTKECQERQSKAWDTLNTRMDKFLNNELKHVDERLLDIEGKGISGADWAKIILAIITAAGGVFIALVNRI